MKQKSFWAKFNGVKYRVDLEPFDAICTPPKLIDREAVILLPKGFKHNKYTLELLIHEAVHCSDWSLPEAAVERMGREIANMLWRLYDPRDEVRK